MRYALSILSFLVVLIAVSQPTITTSVDRNVVGSGQSLKLTITLEGSRNPIQNPDIDGFVIVQGPFESNNFSWVNGKMSSTVTRQYVLRAGEPGTYTIGPAKVEANGKVFSSKPITITVTKGAANSGGGGGNVNANNRDLFATIELSKRSVFVGEQVIATYTLYNRYPSLELTGNELPPLTGFWSEEIDLGNTSWEPNLRTINGISYRVAILKKQVLFPQKSGELTIEPMKLECVVGSGGFFGRRSRKTVYSDRAKVKVKPLPTPAPPDFVGAVGTLKMSAMLDRHEVPANEAVNLKVTFSGRCNLKLLDAPDIELPSDFEVYDPKIEDRVKVGGNGMSGARSIDYLIIPRHAGEYKLESISVSYFNPSTEKYERLESGELKVKVLRGEGGETIVTRPAEKRDVEELDSDIRFIRTGDLALRPKEKFLYGSLPYAAGMAAPALAFLLFLFIRRRKEQRDSDVAGSRSRKARRIAKQRLAEASRSLEKDDQVTFYETLHRGLLGYLADKFNLSTSQLDKASIVSRSEEAGVSSDDAQSMGKLIEELQMARYAPVISKADKTLLDLAMNLVESFENQLS